MAPVLRHGRACGGWVTADGPPRRSLIGQMTIIGGVEIVDTYFAGRVPLQRIPNTEREALQNFIPDITERDTAIKTAGYANPEGRPISQST
jgi:hypothetical protein